MIDVLRMEKRQFDEFFDGLSSGKVQKPDLLLTGIYLAPDYKYLEFIRKGKNRPVFYEWKM